MCDMTVKVILAAISTLILAAGFTGPVQAGDRSFRYRCGPILHTGQCRCGPVCGWPDTGPYCRRGYGWRPGGPDRSAFGSSLSRGEAKKLIQWMIRRDPNLEVGSVLKAEEGYEVTIVTRKGENLIDTLFVEKDTAHIYRYKSTEE